MNRWTLVALVLLIVAGCPNAPSDNANGNGDDQGDTGNSNQNSNSNSNSNDNSPDTGDTLGELPFVSPDDPGSSGLAPDVSKPAVAAPPAIFADQALLNEVRFHPAGGDPPFVELKSPAGASVTGLVISNSAGETLTLSGDAAASAAGFLVIIFDGANSTGVGETHSAATDFLDPSGGMITLKNGSGDVLDQVAWGTGQPDAVPSDSGGGLGNEAVQAGLVIARPPDSILVGLANWAALPGAWATPGAANPNVGASVLLPMSGFVEEAGPVVLGCYPTNGAAEYRFQVSRDSKFKTLTEDITIDQPSVTVMLTAGVYFWRVATVAADATQSAFSPANKLTIEENIDTEATAESDAAKPRGRAQAAGSRMTRTLDADSPGGHFPSFSQRKDTHLLLLESNRTDSGFEWDKPHPVFHLEDFADNLNCSLAAAQMVNHFYGGNLSQDRIGYELHKDDAPGPETDLNYGEGNTPDRPVSWALGGARVSPVYGAGARVDLDSATLWKNVMDSIDGGRPVVVAVTRRAGGTHTVVIIGYQIDSRRAGAPAIHRFLVADPGNEGQANAKRNFVDFSEFYWQTYSYYLLDPGAHTGRKQEASIGKDTDGDQVYDFDESERFHTRWNMNSPASRDSDDDCISDYNEIKLSVLDEKHGVGVYRTTRHGDGRARARNAPELTLDTDGGGLPDFVEDLNQDGKIDKSKGESDPYDSADDRRRIKGTVKSYKQRDELPYRLYFRQVDDDFDVRTNTSGKLTGSWKIKIEAQAMAHAEAAPPQCPEPRTIVTDYDPFDYTTMNIEGQFFCYPGTSPAIVLSEKEPNKRHYQNTHYTDSCLGPTNGVDPMGWTPLVSRIIRSVEFPELIVGPGRVQWKYRIAPSSDLQYESGSWIEVDLTMTPGN